MSRSSVDVSVRMKVNSGGYRAGVVDNPTEEDASVGGDVRLSDLGFFLKMFFIVSVDSACPQSSLERDLVYYLPRESRLSGLAELSHYRSSYEAIHGAK